MKCSTVCTWNRDLGAVWVGYKGPELKIYAANTRDSGLYAFTLKGKRSSDSTKVCL